MRGRVWALSLRYVPASVGADALSARLGQRQQSAGKAADLLFPGTRTATAEAVAVRVPGITG